MEPWLGQVSAIKDLPLPRLIAVQIDRDNPPDLSDPSRRADQLNSQCATLDDHRAWQQQIRRVTGSLAIGGVAIIILMGTATIAVVVSAARSAMASNREIIEVLNFVGAEERFIARQFELHFLEARHQGGHCRCDGRRRVVLLLPIITEYLSGAATHAEIRRLVGTGRLDFMGYASLRSLSLRSLQSAR